MTDTHKPTAQQRGIASARYAVAQMNPSTWKRYREGSPLPHTYPSRSGAEAGCEREAARRDERIRFDDAALPARVRS